MSLQGDVGCRGILARHDAEVLKVRVDDPGVVTDIDTAGDLRRCYIDRNVP